MIKKHTMHTGGALLMVLMLIVILTTSTMLALNNWSRATHTQVAFLNHSQQLRILADYRIAISQWLTDHTKILFFPVSEQQQSWLLCDDTLRIGTQDYRIQVSLYDALAGIPPALASTGTALHETLPSSLQSIHLKPYLSNDPVSIWRIPLPLHTQRFPLRHHNQDELISQTWTRWGNDSDVVEAGSMNNRDNNNDRSESPTWATWVSPYNDRRININTCPLSVLEFITTAVGYEYISALIELRNSGLLRDVPAAMQGAGQGKKTPGNISVVSQSDIFYALLSMSHNAHTQRWFLVLSADGKQNAMIRIP